MMRGVCAGDLIEKTRYEVPHAGLTWEVDVYGGSLAGIVLAEVELDHDDQPFEAPDWTGREVTGDPRFRQGDAPAPRRRGRPARDPGGPRPGGRVTAGVPGTKRGARPFS